MKDWTEANAASARLFEAGRSGDPDALGELLMRTVREIRGAIWQIVGDDELVADVIQDTAVEFLTGLDSIQEPTAVARFIKQSARNNAIDARRRRHNPVGKGYSSNYRKVELEEAWNVPDSSADPATFVGSREELAAAWRRLPERDSRLLGLLVVGYELGEIAALEGIGRGATKVAIHRARTKLRELLGLPEQVTAGRTTGQRKHATFVPRTRRAEKVRVWAAQQGIDCPPSGRPPRELVEAYEAAVLAGEAA